MPNSSVICPFPSFKTCCCILLEKKQTWPSFGDDDAGVGGHYVDESLIEVIL